jgi:hypothetical protein
MPMRTVMATDADLGDDLVEVLDVLGDPRGHRPGLRQLLSAVQSQADPEQPPDDVLVQIPGDPVPIGGHLQFGCAARLSARCTVGQAGDVARYVVGEHRAGGGPADRDSPRIRSARSPSPTVSSPVSRYRHFPAAIPHRHRYRTSATDHPERGTVDEGPTAPNPRDDQLPSSGSVSEHPIPIRDRI